MARKKEKGKNGAFLIVREKITLSKKSEDHNSGLWCTPYQVAAEYLELKAILVLGSRETCSFLDYPEELELRSLPVRGDYQVPLFDSPK